MEKSLENGRWFRVESEEEFDKILTHGTQNPDSSWEADIKKGYYVGPGLYMLFKYSQRCSRNCCYDSVYELVPANEIVDMVKDEMIKLSEILKKARKG